MFMGSGLAPLARPGMTLWRKWRDRDPGALELRSQRPCGRNRGRLVAVDADGVDLDRDALAADRLEALRLKPAQHPLGGELGVVQHRARLLAAREVAGVVVSAVGEDLARHLEPELVGDALGR